MQSSDHYQVFYSQKCDPEKRLQKNVTLTMPTVLMWFKLSRMRHGDVEDEQ